MRSIEKMFAHLHWANMRLLEGLQKGNGQQHASIQLFAHVLLAEQVWLARLQGKDSLALPLWSEIALQDCSELVSQNMEQFNKLLKQLANGERDLEDVIQYSNSKGHPFQTSIRDVLTHVALHGQYHRGQINARLRGEDSGTINVDYITFVREREMD